MLSLYSIDATDAANRTMGRMINHSRLAPNVKPVSEFDQGARYGNGKWKVHFKATRDIKKGESLRYDYGERRPVR